MLQGFAWHSTMIGLLKERGRVVSTRVMGTGQKHKKGKYHQKITLSPVW